MTERDPMVTKTPKGSETAEAVTDREPEPVPDGDPATVSEALGQFAAVSASAVAASATTGASHPDDVRLVVAAMKFLGWLEDGHVVSGIFDAVVRSAYADFQRALGARGLDVDGVPDRTSLSILGHRSNLFTVTS